MKKISTLAFICLVFVSCRVGDPNAPGIPRDFRYVCDASTLAQACPAPNTRALIWIASGDDGYSGQALQYDLRWSDQPMTETAFKSTNQFIHEPTPQPSDNIEVIFLPRIYPGAYLSFGLIALDEVAQVSGLASTPLVKQDFIRGPFGDTGAAQPGFGTVVEPLGDLDFRKIVDIAVGAPAADSPNTVATGAVFVYLNARDTYLITKQNNIPCATSSLSPALVIYGQTAGGQFGASITSELDFNGDNVADLIVGEPGTGKVYIFFGGGVGAANFTSRDVNPAAPVQFSTAQADVTIISPTIGFGSSVVLLWNINTQTGTELLIGSPSEGRAYLFYGGLHTGNSISGSTPLSVVLPADCSTPAAGCADWTIIGPTGSDFGKIVARTQGLTPGGVENFAISSPGMDIVYVFLGGEGSGKAIDFSVAGPQTRDLSAGGAFDLLIRGEAGSQFGSAIAARRSLNNTTSVSLAIGAPATDKVYVWYGGGQGLIKFPLALNTVWDAILDGADQVITGDPSTNFGASLSTMADLNGNGWFDLLVGAPHALDGSLADVGAVYEFLSDLTKPAIRTTANSDYVSFGTAVSGQFGADVAGIGMLIPVTPIQRIIYYDDFIVGAPGANAAYAEF